MKIPIPKKVSPVVIEKILVLALFLGLGAIGSPIYNNFTNKLKVSSTVAEMQSLEADVSQCILKQGLATGCSQGEDGIPSMISPTRNASHLQVHNGVITGRSSATTSSGAPMGFTLSPTVGGTTIAWGMSGALCNAERGLGPGEGGCP